MAVAELVYSCTFARLARSRPLDLPTGPPVRPARTPLRVGENFSLSTFGAKIQNSLLWSTLPGAYPQVRAL
jgi:hypothetical protein